ncbi:MAG: glycosyltransferase family 4 protein, partial [Candidatus Aureabacteria bacterium]|nr:glycosyltransferase family 4 protein [Candidatus Auribacterota bacterium]
MNICIITPCVDENDWLYGAFCPWIGSLSKQADNILVLTLKKGAFDFKGNVRVIRIKNCSTKVSTLLNLYKNIISYNKEYPISCFFTHMCPIYVTALFPLKCLLKIPVVMWHAHGTKSLKLRMAEILCDRVISSSESGFPVKTAKLSVVGQAIDTDRFKAGPAGASLKKMLYAGRISRIKNILGIVETVNALRSRGFDDIRLSLAGAASTGKDAGYMREIKEYISSNGLEGNIEFLGPVSYRDIHNTYNTSGIFINLSDTDSLDRSVLEAMSSGNIVITSNRAFRPFYLEKSPALFLDKKEPGY